MMHKQSFEFSESFNAINISTVGNKQQQEGDYPIRLKNRHGSPSDWMRNGDVR